MPRRQADRHTNADADASADSDTSDEEQRHLKQQLIGAKRQLMFAELRETGDDLLATVQNLQRDYLTPEEIHEFKRQESASRYGQIGSGRPPGASVCQTGKRVHQLQPRLSMTATSSHTHGQSRGPSRHGLSPLLCSSGPLPDGGSLAPVSRPFHDEPIAFGSSFHIKAREAGRHEQNTKTPMIGHAGVRLSQRQHTAGSTPKVETDPWSTAMLQQTGGGTASTAGPTPGRKQPLPVSRSAAGALGGPDGVAGYMSADGGFISAFPRHVARNQLVAPAWTEEKLPQEIQDLTAGAVMEKYKEIDQAWKSSGAVLDWRRQLLQKFIRAAAVRKVRAREGLVSLDEEDPTFDLDPCLPRDVELLLADFRQDMGRNLRVLSLLLWARKNLLARSHCCMVLLRRGLGALWLAVEYREFFRLLRKHRHNRAIGPFRVRLIFRMRGLDYDIYQAGAALNRILKRRLKCELAYQAGADMNRTRLRFLGKHGLVEAHFFSSQLHKARAIQASLNGQCPPGLRVATLEQTLEQILLKTPCIDTARTGDIGVDELHVGNARVWRRRVPKAQVKRQNGMAEGITASGELLMQRRPKRRRGKRVHILGDTIFQPSAVVDQSTAWSQGGPVTATVKFRHEEQALCRAWSWWCYYTRWWQPVPQKKKKKKKKQKRTLVCLGNSSERCLGLRGVATSVAQSPLQHGLSRGGGVLSPESSGFLQKQRTKGKPQMHQVQTPDMQVPTAGLWVASVLSQAMENPFAADDSGDELESWCDLSDLEEEADVVKIGDGRTEARKFVENMLHDSQKGLGRATDSDTATRQKTKKTKFQQQPSSKSKATGQTFTQKLTNSIPLGTFSNPLRRKAPKSKNPQEVEARAALGLPSDSAQLGKVSAPSADKGGNSMGLGTFSMTLRRKAPKNEAPPPKPDNLQSEQLLEVEAGEDVQQLGLIFDGAPPETVTVQSVDKGGWAESSYVQVGDALVSVNLVLLSNMSKGEFKRAMRSRPLVLAFDPSDAVDHVEEANADQQMHELRPQEVVEVEAAAEVTQMGLTFDTTPPDPVLVKSVVTGGWASTCGIQVNALLSAVNGTDASSMSKKEFKNALRQRPVRLAFVQALVDGREKQKVRYGKGNKDPEQASVDSDLAREVTAIEEDRPLGMRFEGLPPGILKVTSVTRGLWADRQEIKPGDLIIAANDEDLEDMSRERFKELISQRPLRLVIDPPDTPGGSEDE